MAKFPFGEETLPIVEVEGKLLTLAELEEQYPELYRQLLEPTRAVSAIIMISDELLVERVRRRVAQGREPTIYRWGDPASLTPEEQLAHMEARDAIGLELIAAERKLLEEELRMLRE